MSCIVYTLQENRTNALLNTESFYIWPILSITSCQLTHYIKRSRLSGVLLCP